MPLCWPKAIPATQGIAQILPSRQAARISAVIAGRVHDLIAVLKRHPLIRALRMDKATIAGLAATLRHYVLDEVETTIPVWRMISAEAEDLRQRAERWQEALASTSATVGVESATSMIGGGSLPGESLPTFVLAVRGTDRDGSQSAQRLAERLRMGDPAVVARVEHDAVLLDPRTVDPDEDEALIAALKSILPAR